MGKMDPRVLRTRSKLRKAFLELVTEKSLSEINIKDLTNTANVTRGTFYLHYKDKDNFIKTVVNEILNEYFESIVYYVSATDTNTSKEESKKIPVISLIHIFEFVAQEQDFFLFLLKENGAHGFQYLMNERIKAFMVEFMEAKFPDADKAVPNELLVNFLMYGQLGYIYTWLSEGMIYASHFMAKNLRNLLTSDAMTTTGLDGFFVFDANEEPQALSLAAAE